jgi:hypothetical protein
VVKREADEPADDSGCREDHGQLTVARNLDKEALFLGRLGGSGRWGRFHGVR